MATKKTSTPKEIYQIKITLLGTRPPIWRRLLVPAKLTLEQLHAVLQIAMGWEECHLHDFRIGRERYTIPDLDDDFPPAGDERKVRLSSVLGKVGARAVYTYDLATDGSMRLSSRRCFRRSRGALTRFAPAVNVTAHPRIAAVWAAITAFWKRSPTPRTKNTNRCLNGWAAASIRKLSPSTRSTVGWPEPRRRGLC